MTGVCSVGLHWHNNSSVSNPVSSLIKHSGHELPFPHTANAKYTDLLLLLPPSQSYWMQWIIRQSIRQQDRCVLQDGSNNFHHLIF